MGKPNRKRMESEMRAKRAFSELRLKLGRMNLTREEVAQVREELAKRKSY